MCLRRSPFLDGLAAHELSREKLDHRDADYEVSITVRAGFTSANSKFRGLVWRGIGPYELPRHLLVRETVCVSVRGMAT